VYLIILIKKTQNYKISIFLLFLNLLPFTIGRNILEVNLLKQTEIYGFSLFDVKYFMPLYLSDLFLLLIYQNYFSDKFFKKKTKKLEVSKTFKIALISFLVFFLLVVSRSINHEFGNLLFFGSLIILKYLLIFALPIIVGLKTDKDKKLAYQTIASMTFFQIVIIFIEQFKGGNIGRFIENRLPGIEIGVRASESANLLRADGTFNEPNIAAIFLLMNAFLLINFGLKKWKTKNTNPLYLIIGIIALFTIIFTGSRSLYALTFCGVIFYLIKYKSAVLSLVGNWWQKKSLKLVGLIFLAIGLPYLLTRINTLKNIFSSDGSLAYRQELGKAILSMSSHNFLGIGLDLTSYYLAKNFKTVDNQFLFFDQAPAHNILIQIFTETGTLACLVFIFFVYCTLRTGLMKKNNSFALASLAYFLAAQFHPVFTNHYELTAFFFLYLGLNLDEKS